MDRGHAQVNGAGTKYSGKNFSIPVNFLVVAPAAKKVSVVGDFNDWHPEEHPMKRRADGSWGTQISLAHGHHQYRFWVDGEQKLDPRAQGVGRNAQNEKVSLLAVS